MRRLRALAVTTAVLVLDVVLVAPAPRPAAAEAPPPPEPGGAPAGATAEGLAAEAPDGAAAEQAQPEGGGAADVGPLPPGSSREPESEGFLREGGRYLFRTYPRRVFATAYESFTGLGLLAIAAAGAMVPALDGTVDRRVRQGEAHEDHQNTGIRVAEQIGAPLTMIGASFLTAVAGRLAGSDSDTETGTTLLEMLPVVGGSTEILKLTVRRRRPDGTDTDSFPSGHASVTFSVATVLSVRYGWYVGVPAFGVATFVSATRLEANRHFFSDVYFGAALGTVIGFSATQVRERERAREWALVPIALPAGGGGLALVGRW